MMSQEIHAAQITFLDINDYSIVVPYHRLVDITLDVAVSASKAQVAQISSRDGESRPVIGEPAWRSAVTTPNQFLRIAPAETCERP